MEKKKDLRDITIKFKKRIFELDNKDIVAAAITLLENKQIIREAISGDEELFFKQLQNIRKIK